MEPLLEECRRAQWRAAWLHERPHRPDADTGGWNLRSRYWSTHRWVTETPSFVRYRTGPVATGLVDFAQLLDAPADAHAGEGWPEWIDEADVTALSSPPAAPPAPPAGGATAGIDPEAAERSLLGLLEPVVRRYRDRQAQRVAAAFEHLPDGVRAHLVGVFAATFPDDEVRALALPTLVLEWAVDWAGSDSGGPAAARLDAFLRRMATPASWLAFWSEYPVLLRVLASTCRRWADATGLLAQRFAEDHPLLVRSGFVTAAAGALQQVDIGAGDPHRGGHSVAILRFSDGAVVYKPRSLAADAAVAGLLHHLRDVSDIDLTVPAVLDRTTHGWASYVVADAPGERRDEEALHRRVGWLLAVCHALQITDLHHENLVTVGAHPVVVDLETIVDPARPHPADTDADALLASSVARTGLLPLRIGFEDGEGVRHFVDPSPLAAQVGWPHQFDRPRLVLDQDDGPRLQAASSVAPPPTAEAPPPREDPYEHLDVILSAFRSAYGLLRKVLPGLVADGEVAALADLPVRHLLRSTRVYSTLLGQSYHPDFLRDGRDRDVLLDRLWNGIDEERARSGVVHVELAQLREGDIPLFEVVPADRDLRSGTGVAVPGFFPRPPFRLLVDHLDAMDDRRCAVQERFIALALACRSPVAQLGPRAGASPVLPVGGGSAADAVRGVVDRVLDLRLPGVDAVQWLVAHHVVGPEWTVQPAGRRLGSGLPGIALALDVAGRAVGDGRATTAARAAVAALVRDSGAGTSRRGRLHPEDYVAADVGLFGATLSAAVALGTLSDTVPPDWREEATRLLAHAAPGVERTRSLAVADGLAGALLAGLVLETPLGEAAQGLAASAAARLTEQWAEWFGGPGLADGDCGVALALGRWTARSGEEQGLPVIAMALRRAREAVSAGLGGTSWWSGAAGAGLACQALLRLDLGREVEDEAAALLTAARELLLDRWAPGRLDRCAHDGLRDGACGELAALVLLTDADDGSAVGRRLLGELARAPRCGTPRGIGSPDLLAGLAGVGLAVAALVDAAAVRSALTFAPRGSDSP